MITTTKLYFSFIFYFIKVHYFKSMPQTLDQYWSTTCSAWKLINQNKDRLFDVEIENIFHEPSFVKHQHKNLKGWSYYLTNHAYNFLYQEHSSELSSWSACSKNRKWNLNVFFKVSSLKRHGLTGVGAIPYMSNVNVTVSVQDLKVTLKSTSFEARVEIYVFKKDLLR